RLLLAYDAVDGATAGILSSYSAVILGRFEREEQAELAVERRSAAPLVRTSPSFWYNRELSYRAFMVPGILVELVTMVGLLLCALNIVREREIGTIEQLNVTPLKRWQFIVGKLVPFWLLGLAALALGLLVAKLVFAIPIRGSVPLVFAIAAVYLLAMNGLGLAVSALSYTQQQATFLALFVLLASILLSGLFTPIDSMPLWAQKLTLANPMAHFVEINRRILLKGSGFGEIQDHFWYLPAAAGIILPLAVLRYRKVGS
ncbi:MAG TPA: ABC transporter permease, partial [Thermoanaerobaculia bacterium]|nr:ABC transporter permease [Thermoanaerobaculia bacterium]